MNKQHNSFLRALRRLRLRLRIALVTGDETRLGLLERIIGRRYFFVVLHDNDGDYLCSTIFLLEKVARDYAFKEGGYVISERYREVYRRVISQRDMLSGLYRPSYRELIKTYGQ